MARTRNKNGHSTNTSCETSPIRQHLSELALEATQNITRELSMFEEMRSMMERIMGELADVKVEIRQMREEQTALRQQLERSNQRQTPPTVIRQRPGSQLQGPEVRQPEVSPSHLSASQDYELPPPVQSRLNIPPRAERRSFPEGRYTPASSANTGSSLTSMVLPRDSIPIFSMSIPASEPLRRNQEIEMWIKAIESSPALFPTRVALLLHVPGVGEWQKVSSMAVISSISQTGRPSSSSYVPNLGERALQGIFYVC